MVLWDLFLIKILLKKEICGSYEQCTESTEKTEMHFLKKKKKKKTQTQTRSLSAVSKRYLSLKTIRLKL